MDFANKAFYDSIFCIIDRRRKFPVTMLLRALGFSTNADIFKAFNCIEKIKIKSKNIDSFIGSTVVEDVIDETTGEIFLEGGSELLNNVFQTPTGSMSE